MNLRLKFDLPRKNVALIVVADSEALIQVYDEFFTKAGLRIIAKIRNITDLIGRFESNEPEFSGSVVLIDCGLPRADCLETLELLKQKNPEQRIILASAENLSEIRSDERLYTEVIEKPFTMAELLAAVEKLTSPLRLKGSWIFEDRQEVDRLLQDIAAETRTKMCSVRTASSFVRGLSTAGYTPSYSAAVTRGLRVFLITEITNDNLYYCKQVLLNMGVRLRHLRGVQQNFAIWDEKHFVETIRTPDDVTARGPCLYSNLDQIVRKNQFLFDYLWKISIPAEEKIKELEATSIPGTVRILSGPEEILQTMSRMIRNSQKFLYISIVPPYAIDLANTSLLHAFSDAVERKVPCRILYEITKENLDRVKRATNVGIEMRHLSNMRGSLGFSESELMTTATFSDQEKKQNAAVLYSSHKGLIEQHKAIFEKLWGIAIPAELRVKELDADKEVPRNHA